MTESIHDQADDIVVLGLLLDSSHTHGPGVAHPHPDSSLRVRPAPVDALPIHDTSPEPAPRRKVATPDACGPNHTLVTANNHEAERPGALLRPVATAVLSVICAALLVAGAVLLMRLAASMSRSSTPITTASTAAVAFCGLLLITASILGQVGRR